MSHGFAESDVEESTLSWSSGLGLAHQPGPSLAPGELSAERRDFAQVVLEERLRQALRRLNPDLPAEACREAFRKPMLAEGANLVGRNRAVHRVLVDGVSVEYTRKDGSNGMQAHVRVTGTVSVQEPHARTGRPGTRAFLQPTHEPAFSRPIN